MGSNYTVSKGSVFCISGPEDDFTLSRNMLPVQYASTINIGVLDGQFLILLLNIFVVNSTVKFIQLRTFTSFSSAPDFSNTLLLFSINTNCIAGQAKITSVVRNAFNFVKPLNYV